MGRNLKYLYIRTYVGPCVITYVRTLGLFFHVRTYVICAYARFTGVPVCGTPLLFDRTNFELRMQVKNVKNFD